jgi:GINS complex subunit 1
MAMRRTSLYAIFFIQNSLTPTHTDQIFQVQHAKRAQALPTVPPYQAELVRTTVREVRAQNLKLTSIHQSAPSGWTPNEHPDLGIKMVVEIMGMRRNKRCLLAYHRQRVERVAELVWRGVDLEEGQGQGDGEDSASNSKGNALSPEEEEYARGYAELLAAYKGQWTDIDLTGSLEPPRDLFVDVRVLKDAGEIQTEYGYVLLEDME